MHKPKLSLAEIWNMNFGFLGIQFGWGLQLANMSAIYSKLGADPDQIPILWLAGPVTGLLIQPIIGAMSDRTWCRLGRRRPYFLVGAILASMALFVMPDSPTLMFAASMLWVLDASINVSMEPFRAFVADKLNSEQRTFGFIMQSFFIGIGATLANALPMIFHYFGMEGMAGNGVPLTVMYSFKIGAAAFLLCVLWTVFSTKEYPPDPDAPELKTTVGETLKAIPAELLSAARQMPETMKQLAPVQICTWLGLFCMWMFFGLATAYHVFKAPNPQSPVFDRAIEWAGWCFAIYSIVCFLVAFILPKLAQRFGCKAVHTGALCLGGLSLLSIYFVHDKAALQLLMLGVGVAWASILSMPYAILAGALPAKRIGLYMGLFNFFIVIPEIVASLCFQPLVKYVFANNPVYVVMLGGASLLVAALLTQRVTESKQVEEAPPIGGEPHGGDVLAPSH
jgi:maltose/moltooligosaccharide transporter